MLFRFDTFSVSSVVWTLVMPVPSTTASMPLRLKMLASLPPPPRAVNPYTPMRSAASSTIFTVSLPSGTR